MDKHQLIMLLLFITIVISGANLAFTAFDSSDANVAPSPSDLVFEGDVPEVEEAPTTRLINEWYELFPFSFEYPVGMHVTGHRFFDSPNRVRPDIEYGVSRDPVVVTSPSGGPGHVPAVSVWLNDENTAINGLWEGRPEWQTVTKDTVMVDGQSADRYTITTDMTNRNVSYEFAFEELVFVNRINGSSYTLQHIYNTADQADEEAWTLLLDTFSMN